VLLVHWADADEVAVRIGDDDGRLTVTIGYDQLDAVRQLLQFSDHIEITRPPAARELVRMLAEQIARRHR
jgi:hypothetical protein